MDKLKVFISRDEIKDKVAELAAEIRRDYRGTNPLLLGVLKGSFVFMADLARALDMPVGIEFIRLASYGAGRETSGKVKVVQGLKMSIKGRHVLVIEDIVDTGITINFFLEYLSRRGPLSIRLCALFDKPSRRTVPVTIDYPGFTVPDAFVVGYGLDFAEEFRCLPDLCVLEKED
ncbi:hypoxanthine phosphoribosyltransferase [Chloroflexota bacterium]